jgi:hypothetical protein
MTYAVAKNNSKKLDTTSVINEVINDNETVKY